MSLKTEKFIEVSPGRVVRYFLWDRQDVPTTFAWSNLTGVPSEFPPSHHTHDWTDITGTPATYPPADHTHSIYDLTGWHFGAIGDLDDETVTDVDDVVCYEPGEVFDNPPAPTRYFDTVADMLASDATKWDRAVTRNYLTGDGDRAEWRMAADPVLADNGFNILATVDGYGFAERVALLR